MAWYNQDDKHILVKKLKKCGWIEFEIAYASYSSPDYGWSVIHTSEKEMKYYGCLLGSNIKGALSNISDGKFNL